MHNTEKLLAKITVKEYWTSIAESEYSAPETKKMAKQALRQINKEIAKLLSEEMNEK